MAKRKAKAPTTIKKGTRGGVRPGSGRKPKPNGKNSTFSIPMNAEIVDFVRSIQSTAEWHDDFLAVVRRRAKKAGVALPAGMK